MKKMHLICCFIILLFNVDVWAQSGDNQKICLSCQGGEGGGGSTGSDPCSILTTNDTLYVDASKTNNNGAGTSWATAKKNLQAALYIANYCSNPNKKIVFIKVAKGTYKSSTTVNSNARDYTFFIGNKYSIMGGYPTGGGSEAQRDFVNNPTILDGEIQDLYESYHVLVIYDVSGAVVIDGFQIKNGFADGIGNMEIETNVNAPRDVGAGAFIRDAANVKFSNCVFYSNVASSSSGAIYSRNSSLELENCVFVNNTSGTYGGAIQNVSGSDISITNCTFYNNLNLGGGEAIYTNSGSTLTMHNSIVWGNTKAFAGGGVRTTSHCLLPNSGGSNFNLSDDPKFINVSNLNGPDNKWFTQDDGLNLEVCSPAINRGDNAIPTLPSFDITNNDRIFNHQVDIGAYEKQIVPDVFTSTARSIDGDSSDSYVFDGATALYVNNECRIIAIVKSESDLHPLSGRIKAKTIIESADLTYQGIPLVRRHYNINDEFANTNSTGFVSIFFSNSEFNNYNLRSDALAKLPVNSSDPNKVNLRVIKFGAVSQTGSPESYNTSPEALTRYPVSVSWGATALTWEVKFLNYEGLGGYFITSAKDYIFTGNGNWNVAANWQNNEMPPKTLPAYYKIIVAEGSNATLNVPQSLAKDALMFVRDGATLTVTSELNINGSMHIDDDMPLRNKVIVGR